MPKITINIKNKDIPRFRELLENKYNAMEIMGDTSTIDFSTNEAVLDQVEKDLKQELKQKIQSYEITKAKRIAESTVVAEDIDFNEEI